MPRDRSSSDIAPTRLRPPRTLKAQVGLWFSCFTQIERPVASSRSGWRSNGVRATYTSLRVGAFMFCFRLVITGGHGRPVIAGGHRNVGNIGDYSVYSPIEQ